MIDTHAHLNLKNFDLDRKEVMTACRNINLRVINVGIDYQSSLKAIEIASEKGFYATIGCHPNGVKEEISLFRDLLLKKADKVVAIGETGLDFYHSSDDSAEQERQKILFEEHGRLSQEYKKPLVVHCRQAYPDLITMLQTTLLKTSGVIHSFSGNLQDAGTLLNLGYYLGFSGLIFKRDLSEVIKSTPIERMLVETDSPFLSPPGQKEKRNTPDTGLRPVLERIAFIKKTPVAEVATITEKNANELFQLEKYD